MAKSSKSKTTAAAMEQQMLAFAEQLGRMAGTLQVKADGWIDRDALNEQVASLRSGAADLIEQFKGGLSKAAKKKPAAAPARKATGRSGGVVDAPGKKHRKPAPRGAAANRANSQAAKLRAAKTMVKTNRRRGRG
jgi:hypothetical protein